MRKFGLLLMLLIIATIQFSLSKTEEVFEEFKLDTVNSLQVFDSGKIKTLAVDSFEVYFEKEGEMNLSSTNDVFTFNLKIANILLDKPYGIVVNNYGRFFNVTFELIKVNANSFYLDIIQVPKKAIVDRLYFTKNNAVFELSKIEEHQFGTSDQICFFKRSLSQRVDISNLEWIGCFEKIDLHIEDGKTIPIVVSRGELNDLQIDSVIISEEKIPLEVSNVEVVGRFLFSNLDDFNHICSKEVRDFIYSQYEGDETNIRALHFTYNDGHTFYLNVHDQNLIKKYCNNDPHPSQFKNVMATVYVAKIFTPLHNYYLIEGVKSLEEVN